MLTAQWNFHSLLKVPRQGGEMGLKFHRTIVHQLSVILEYYYQAMLVSQD